MAFETSKLTRISSTGNTGAGILWTYKNSLDSLDTIKTSGYFNNAVLDLTNGSGKFAIGHIIYVQTSTKHTFLRVTSVTTNVTVVDFYYNAPWVVQFAGTYIYTGGSTSSVKTITGVTTGDMVIANFSICVNSVFIRNVIAGTDNMTFTYSSDPGLCSISYVVFRQVS